MIPNSANSEAIPFAQPSNFASDMLNIKRMHSLIPNKRTRDLSYFSTSLCASPSPSLFDEFTSMKKRTFTSESQKKDYSQLITNISSICDEISKVVNQVSQRETLQGYFGELILETFSFCELYSLGPEQTTAKSLFKFKSRLEGMKQLAQADGLPDLNLLSSEVMLSYWKKAKNLNPPAIQQSEKNNITDIWEQVVLLENEARAFGFKWTDYRQLIKKIKDECDEAIEVVEGLPYQPERLQEELGDLILATLSFCMYCDFDPKETLEKTLAKKK